MQTRIILNSFEVSAFVVLITPIAASAKAAIPLNRWQSMFCLKQAALSWSEGCQIRNKPELAVSIQSEWSDKTREHSKI